MSVAHVSTLAGLVQSKRVASAPREVVEELRALSLYAPCNGLLPSLLGALRQLRANKKAGEENKVIRAVYQYLSALAASSLLTPEDAAAVVAALRAHDLKGDDGSLPRQLAALQLTAELVWRFPAADRECCEPRARTQCGSSRIVRGSCCSALRSGNAAGARSWLIAQMIQQCTYSFCQMRSAHLFFLRAPLRPPSLPVRS